MFISMPLAAADFAIQFSDNHASHQAVILRESGVSSPPQLLGSIINAAEYWIARFRGRGWKVNRQQ
jgi:hypothetical protein